MNASPPLDSGIFVIPNLCPILKTSDPIIFKDSCERKNAYVNGKETEEETTVVVGPWTIKEHSREQQLGMNRSHSLLSLISKDILVFECLFDTTEDILEMLWHLSVGIQSLGCKYHEPQIPK